MPARRTPGRSRRARLIAMAMAWPMLVLVGCTSESGQSRPASTHGTAIAGPTGERQSSAVVPTTAVGGASAAISSAAAAPGSAPGSARNAPGSGPKGPATVGCTKLPDVVQAKLKPVGGETSDGDLRFGGRASWGGALTVSVAAPKEYEPTAAEKAEATTYFSSDATTARKKISPSYRLLPVTVANNTGKPYDAAQVLNGTVRSGWCAATPTTASRR